MDINGIIGELYKPTIREQFKYHPNRDELVEKMFSGKTTAEQIDLWFAEAERYSLEEFNRRHAPPSPGPPPKDTPEGPNPKL